jgi:diguanylate cyclase (GGDEF)-like protein
MAQGEVLGLLHVNGHTQERGTGAASPEAVEHLAVTVAEHLSLALANLQLRETLRDQSARDSLTGLHNRRSMEERLEREVLEAGRTSRSVALLAVDVDHLEEHSEQRGQPDGDRILQEVAATLLRVTRAEDAVCRAGGTELLVILPEASLEVAVGRAEDLRRAVMPVGAGNPVTLSIGLAAHPLHGASAAALLHAAHVALDQARREGRNRICVSAAPED